MHEETGGRIQVDWARLTTVIFDVGGVLLRTADYGPRHRWDVRLGLAPGTVEETVFNSALGRAAQLGEVTTEGHWQRLGAHLGLSASELAGLRRDFWAGDRFDRRLAGWIEELHGRYRLGIISNAFDDLRRVLEKEFQIAHWFDHIVVSAEEGVMKPDPEIFHRALARLAVAPEAAVFIDDNRENFLAARRLGLSAIHFYPELDLPELWRAKAPG